MINIRLLYIIGIICSILIQSCSPVNGGVAVIELNDTAQSVTSYDDVGGKIAQIKLDFSTVKDVYFVFTNTDGASSSDKPQVTQKNIQHAPKEYEANHYSSHQDASPEYVSHNIAYEHNGIQYLDLYNNISLSDLERAQASEPSSDQLSYSLHNTAYVALGTQKQWYVYENNTPINTELVYTQQVSTNFGDRIVQIWTIPNSLSAQEGAFIGQRFLKSGNNNDIYDWVTGITGKEWGPEPNLLFSNIIGDTKTINIVFYDINNDGKPASGASRVYGYYNAKNQMRNSPNSNKALVFFMDLPVIIDTKFRDDALSTLAHEFQHLIMTYNRYFKNNEKPSVWLNEMFSMVIEDFIAEKLHIPGPRNMPLTSNSQYDFSAGTKPVSLYNRLYFALNNGTRSHMQWAEGNDVLIYYGLNYSFGAYLARTIGPNFIYEFINNKGSELELFNTVLSPLGGYTTALHNWAIAILLSNDVSSTVLSKYQINSSNGFSFSSSTGAYHIGSINMYNYSVPVYNSSYASQQIGSYELSAMEPFSNIIHKAGASLVGINKWTVTVPQNVVLSIVLK